MSDDEEFKRAVSSIRPLNQDTHKPHQKKPKAKKHTRADSHERLIPAHEYDFNLINQDNWVSGSDIISFKQPGLQKALLDKLRKGQYRHEAKIDLHHHTAGEATALIDHLLEQCLADNIRCVLIIHGKGSMSRSDKPILKNIVIEHLRQNKNVLAYHSAHPKDGGSGALYVLMKASHKV